MGVERISLCSSGFFAAQKVIGVWNRELNASKVWVTRLSVVWSSLSLKSATPDNVLSFYFVRLLVAGIAERVD